MLLQCVPESARQWPEINQVMHRQLDRADSWMSIHVYRDHSKSWTLFFRSFQVKIAKFLGFLGLQESLILITDFQDCSIIAKITLWTAPFTIKTTITSCHAGLWKANEQTYFYQKSNSVEKLKFGDSRVWIKDFQGLFICFQFQVLFTPGILDFPETVCESWIHYNSLYSEYTITVHQQSTSSTLIKE